MHSVTELIVRIADLCEAEGRVLRAMAIRLAFGVAIIVVAAILVTGGVALILVSIYLAIHESAGPAVASLVTGLIALGIGGGFTWLARRIGI